jgi:hypothetical protein
MTHREKWWLIVLSLAKCSRLMLAENAGLVAEQVEGGFYWKRKLVHE